MRISNVFKSSAVETHGRASHLAQTHGRASHLAPTHGRASHLAQTHGRASHLAPTHGRASQNSAVQTHGRASLASIEIKNLAIFLALWLILNAFGAVSALAQLNWSGTQNLTAGQVISQNINVTGNVTINVASGEAIISGNITGNSYSVTKTGSGALILTGTNTIPGGTTISNGEIHLGNETTTGSIDGPIINNNILHFRRTNNYYHSGVISGSGVVIKQLSSNLFFTANNTYTGFTNIMEGVLYIGNHATSNGAIAGNITVQNGATLVFYRSNYTYGGVIGGSGDVRIYSTGTKTLSGVNTYTGETSIYEGTLELSGSIENSSKVILESTNAVFALSGSNKTIKGLDGLSPTCEILLGTRTLTIGTSGANDGYGEFKGVISGSGGSIVKQGLGLLYLTGNNTYQGTTTISEGFLLVGRNSTTGQIASSSIINNASLEFYRSNDYTYNGVISGSGWVDKSGAGTLYLTGNNTYTGRTAVYDGTLSIGNNTTSGAIAGDIYVISTLIFNRSNDYTYSGVIRGVPDLSTNGTITKLGSGTLYLTGNSPYLGNTIISAGTLSIGNNTTTGAIAGNIINNAALSFYRSNDFTYSGVISGSGTVTQRGVGSMYLTGTNTYTGTTTINAGAGMITIGNGGTSGAIAGNIVLNANTTLQFWRSNSYGYAGNISGGGSIMKSGAGTVNLTGVISHTGNTTIGEGTLIIANSFTGNITNNATLTFNIDNDYTYGGVISGTGNVVKQSFHTLTLTGANTYSGGTTINQGSLSVGNGGATGAILASGNILNYGTLIFNRTINQTISGVISGSGNVTKLSGSELTLSGANTYNGTTTITAGSILISGAAGDIPGNIVNNGSLRFMKSTPHTYNGVISGSGTLSNEASGTLYLTQTNTYTGNTTINAGTISIGNNTTGGSILGNIVNNGTLRFNRSNPYAYNGIISGTGNVFCDGSGYLILSGNNTSTGTLNCTNGSLELQGNWAGNINKGASCYFTVVGNRTIGGTLSMNGGITNFSLSAATPSRLSVTGAFSASGTNTLNITSVGAASNYILFSAASGVATTNFVTAGSSGYLTSTSTEMTFTPSSAHTPVTDITGIPTTATAFLPLTLTGTVVPSNATNQDIVWSVQNAGTTGANITGSSGNTLNTTGAGTVTVRATIVNGLTPSTNYFKDENITVSLAVLGGTISITGNPAFGAPLSVDLNGLIITPSLSFFNWGTISYQWIRGSSYIAGANGATYTPVLEDIGNTLSVMVSLQNCSGSLLSSPTTPISKQLVTHAPLAPTMASATESSITLDAISNGEYNIDDGAWQSSTTFSGLTPSTTYSFKQRYAETPTHFASSESDAQTFSTTPPSHVPVTDITGIPTTATAFLNLTLSGSVVPSTATNQTIVWSVENAGTTGATIIGTGSNVLATTGEGTVTIRATIINGLTPSTDYYQDVNITVSFSVLGGTVSITGNPVFGSPLSVDLNGMTTTPELSFFNWGTISYQWVRGASDIVGANGATYTPVLEDIGNILSFRVSLQNCSGELTSSPTTPITKQSVTHAPLAPTMASATEFSITLNAITDGEYNINDGAWQTSTTFSGLTPSTAYSFKQRYAETATHFASPESDPATFSTTVVTHIPVTDITGIPTTATATLPLTLTGTVVPSTATNQDIMWSVEDAGTTGAYIPSSHLGNYTGDVNAVVALLGINETFGGITIGLVQSGANHSLMIAEMDLGGGNIIPSYQLDDIIVTPSGAGYNVSKSGSITIVIPEVVVPPTPPFFPIGTTLYNVPATVTLENGYIENNQFDLELKATATLGGFVPVTINIFYDGIKSSNILNTTGAGTATIRATIINGLTPTTPFTKDVVITVSLAELNGTVTISGSPVFGETLTANTVGLTSTPTISDLGTLSYQWIRGTSDIIGATASSYTLVQEDIGSTISVRVTAINCSGNVTSAATTTVLKASQTAPAAPTLASATSTTITLTTVTGCEYNIDDGTWQTSPIFAGLTPETTYSFKQRLAETDTHLASPESSAATFSTTAPDHIPVTDITGIPNVATAFVPLTLTGTVVPSDATNQDIVWSVENAGTTGANITSGNILNTTGLGTATIRATIINGLTPTTPFTKDVVITVSLAELNGTVTISGTPVFGETLTANTVGLTSTPTIPDLGTLSYQWIRGTSDISAATASTYTLVQEDIGSTISVRVTAINCSGNITSVATATVTKAPQTAPAAPTLDYTTAFSIVLNSVEGCEYNIDGGTWQSSPIFAGLTPETTYSFKQRLAETDTHLVSPESSAVTFTTDEVINPVYVITATAGVNGEIDPSGDINVEEGDNQQFYFYPNLGYEIEEVLVDGTSAPAAVTDGFYIFENVDDNHTIHVTFVIKNYVITATAGENGSIDPSGEIVVEHGSDKTFTFTPDLNYLINQVFVDGINNPEAVSNGSYTFVNITENSTIHVTFVAEDAVTYTITASAGDNGSIDPSGEIIIEEGDNQTFTFIPNDGYKIELVLIDGVNDPDAVENGYHTFDNITQDHTIHVTFGYVGIDVNTHGRTSPHVYPNPTTGVFFVRHCGLDPQSPQNKGMLKQVMHDAALEIHDITGRIVHHEPCTVNRATVEIDITHLPTGVYFLKINNETIKIVKR